VRRNDFQRFLIAARVCARHCLRGALILWCCQDGLPRGWVGRQSAKKVLFLVSYYSLYQNRRTVYTYGVIFGFRSSLSAQVAGYVLELGWISTLAIRYRYRGPAQQERLCRIGYQYCTRNIAVSSSAMGFVTAYAGSHLGQRPHQYPRAHP
jgi:hypothetical protein